MANFHKERKQFARLIESHGLTIVDGAKHYAIMRDGAKVSSLSHTPTDSNIFRQAVRELVRDGYLPEACKRIRF